MTDPIEMSNPFPGLRPFGAEENHLFFGREQIVDQLLARLRETRFLGVIGSSGCGKSSLVRAGLIPSLHGGFMTRAGSSWRVAVMRPGIDPLGKLAESLSQSDVLGQQASPDKPSAVLTEVTLRRGDLGLVDCVRLARLPQEDNLLIVVDQFEELFRFKSSGGSEGARDEAVAFVKKLLSAAEQETFPIYVVLTMRSDFIGECSEYPGLPEAINQGQFLVPRMAREQLRSAIAGPILVAGGKITPRLLIRLLNDVGDDPDRLPVLQHALMRTWDHWQRFRSGEKEVDIQHYEAIGTIEHALSSHADEAYEELETDNAKTIAANVFKALTDTTSDNRGIRRPTTVRQLGLITEAGIPEIAEIIDVFRRPERSFLMPPIDVPLKSKTVVDISHESLMRTWDRLIAWTKEENASARKYRVLARAARRYEQGRGGLWHDPDLAIALKWRDETQPTQAWAARYDPAFERAMSFLDESKVEKDRQVAEKRKARRRKLQTAWGISVVLLAFAGYAYVQQQRAEKHFNTAQRAVNDMLADVFIEEKLADMPQTEELRQQLLEKARKYYEELSQDPAADPNLRLEIASAQRRLGLIYEMQGQREQAEAAHMAGVDQLQDLRDEFPDRPLFQHRLGEAYDWLGEQFRPYDSRKAEESYDKALALQRELVNKYPDNPDHRYELGRTLNNRGILLSDQRDRVSAAEESFSEGIDFFQSLRDRRGDPLDTFRLARTKNNLAGLLRDNKRYAEAESRFGEAIVLIKELIDDDPEKRAYRETIAKLYNNLGNLYLEEKKFEPALAANTEARKLLEGLATPVHGLRNELANTNNARGLILSAAKRTEEAEEAFQAAREEYRQLERDFDDFIEDPDLNDRYGLVLANLAILYLEAGRTDDAVTHISQAIEYFNNAVNSSASSSDYEAHLSWAENSRRKWEDARETQEQ